MKEVTGWPASHFLPLIQFKSNMLLYQSDKYYKMGNLVVKHLIVAFLFMLPVLAQGADFIRFKSTCEGQDSVQIDFRKKISDTEASEINRMETYEEYGKYLIDGGNTEEAIRKLNSALKIANNINNYAKVASIANYLANMYAATGSFKKSNDLYIMALESAEKTSNSGEIAKISMNLASNYNYTGDYEKAIKYGLYALKTKESTNNLTRICYHYIAMGNIFRENNNNAKWEEYVHKAYKSKDIEGCASLSDIAKIYNSLGGIAVQKNELGRGLLYYDTLLVLSKEAGYDTGISTALTNSAGIFKQLSDFDRALLVATEAEKYFGENPYDVLFSNNFKAELYQKKGQYAKGLELVNENIKINEINSYSTEKLKCLQLLYELNFKLKNYDAAFFWNDSLRTSESLLRDENIRQSLEELETKYETEKNEQKIELLTFENQLKNQRINASVGIVAALLIVILFLIYISNIKKKQAALVQNDLQQQVLRSQMNPHFIFNVLGSIQNFILNNDTKKASSFLTQFASLVRATLNNSSAETILLADEINMLKDYIELEKMRKANQFSYEIIIEDDLEADFIQIPPMLIQPFIENSIKHGFKDLNRQGFLRLQISDKTNWIEFTIEDNGKGISTSDKGKVSHKSMATDIFEKRKRLFQQKHQKRFKFELLNLKDVNPELSGVKITVDIPVLNND